MRKTILTAALLSLTITAFAMKRKVLFIGNSYIYTNNMPQMLQQMAAAMGDTLIFDQNTIGGYTMQQHSTDQTTISKIFAQIPWDIVVLQEQSQKPAFSPGQVASETYPYAHMLDSMVRAAAPCQETMFFMTWGYKNGDAGNCPFYPPICTYAGMQQRLRESYLEMTNNEQAIVSPVGAAWKMARDSFPNIDLYSPDNSHPSMSGSYLQTCVFYASIFHRSPLGCSYSAGLPQVDVTNLQRIAGRLVMDSLSFWQPHRKYVYSGFSYTINNKTVTFTNKSLKATNYAWTFGDATTSTQTSPVHTYANYGQYLVTLKASGGCFSEDRKDTVKITGTSGINEQMTTAQLIVSNVGDETVFLLENAAGKELTVFDLAGKMVFRESLDRGRASVKLVSGIYIYIVAEQNSGNRLTGKFTVR